MDSNEMKRLINRIIKQSAQETMRIMFIRIVDGERFKDVTPEVANCLRRKKMVYFCGNCSDLHVEDGVTWEALEAEVQLHTN